MNGFRIFAALVLTAIATWQWYNVESRQALERRAREQLAIVEASSPPLTPQEVDQIRDAVETAIARGPRPAALIAIATVTSVSCAMWWALTIRLARHAERIEAVT